MWNKPRPESSTIVWLSIFSSISCKKKKSGVFRFWISIILNSQDRETAAKLSNSCEKTQLYRELASAAESGWDFSTRWMRFGCALFNFSFIFWSKYCDWIDYCFRNASDLTTLSTTFVLPVDLNAFILKVRLKTSFWMLQIQLIALFSLAKTNEYHLLWVRWNSI